MKTHGWLILGMVMATSALAQNNPNTLPPIPAPAAAPVAEEAPAVAPAPVKHKKHTPALKRAAISEPAVTLVPGPAQVAANNLMVRGQAGLKGEAVAKMNQGDMVTVISQINLDKPAVGEPAQWAKIALPASTHVWVSSKYIDASTKTVTARRLNLRGGPGENYSVLGVIEGGTAVNEIETKGNWTEIDPPSGAYAFVAAMYLKQEAPSNLAANSPTPKETIPPSAMAPIETPTPPPVVAAPPVETALPVTTPPATEPAPSQPSPVVMDNNPPARIVPATPRIVSHEGVVGPVASIIAPTAYELYDPDTRQEINFLYTTSTNLDISRYNGMRIIVTGEESLAERWKNTPLLTIQRIQVLDTNAVPKVYLPSPRQRD